MKEQDVQPQGEKWKSDDRFVGRGGGQMVWTILEVYDTGSVRAKCEDGQERLFYFDQMDRVLN